MTNSSATPASSSDDFVTSVGQPLLAHRLRRASEAVLGGIGAFLPDCGIDVPPRAASTILLLADEGAMGITDIARRIRLSHPLIIKLIDELVAKGLVDNQPDQTDRRRRRVELTRRGHDQAVRLLELNRIASAALDRIWDETGIDLYRAVEALENALARRSLPERLGDEAGRTR